MAVSKGGFYMIWKNKSKELDKLANKLVGKFDKPLKIYIFGAGKLGSILAETLQFFGGLGGFIDNDIKKQQQGFHDQKVYSVNEYLKKHNGMIVVAASIKNIPIIEVQLQNLQLVHKKDYFFYEEFYNDILPIIALYSFHKSYIPLVQVTVTERCSLKCRKCAHGCYAVKNTAKDLTLQQIYKSADSFFAKIDFIREFVLIGGEPLLYKELAQAIAYIGEKYRNQMEIYSITTNGTILPSKEVLEACQKYNVLFRISNYKKQIPRLKTSYKNLTDTLDKYYVPYILGSEEIEWFDYGFESGNRGRQKEELVKVFDQCHTLCREVRENRFYYCVMARSVSENLSINVGENDYLDLDQLEGEKGKKELLEFHMGYSEKGYLDMCDYCSGKDASIIPAAEQI